MFKASVPKELSRNRSSAFDSTAFDLSYIRPERSSVFDPELRPKGAHVEGSCRRQAESSSSQAGIQFIKFPRH